MASLTINDVKVNLTFHTSEQWNASKHTHPILQRFFLKSNDVVGIGQSGMDLFLKKAVTSNHANPQVLYYQPCESVKIELVSNMFEEYFEAAPSLIANGEYIIHMDDYEIRIYPNPEHNSTVFVVIIRESPDYNFDFKE